MFITRVGCQCLSDYHYKSQTLCYEKYRVATGEVLTRAYMLGVCSTRINTRRKTGKYPVCRKLKSQTTSLPGRMVDNVVRVLHLNNIILVFFSLKSTCLEITLWFNGTNFFYKDKLSRLKRTSFQS